MPPTHSTSSPSALARPGRAPIGRGGSDGRDPALLAATIRDRRLDFIEVTPGHFAQLAAEGGVAVNERGVVYAGVRGARLVALSPDGRWLWALKLPATPAGGLLLSRGLIYFGASGGAGLGASV